MYIYFTLNKYIYKYIYFTLTQQTNQQTSKQTTESKPKISNQNKQKIK